MDDDPTLDPDFIEQSADRLLAWEWIHGHFCGGKHLRPCRLAERIGLPTKEVQDIIAISIEKARAAQVNTPYAIIEDRE